MYTFKNDEEGGGGRMGDWRQQGGDAAAVEMTHCVPLMDSIAFLRGGRYICPPRPQNEP